MNLGILYTYDFIQCVFIKLSYLWYKMFNTKKFKHKLWNNKRGDDMLVDFWAILVFAIILIIFFILFAANRHKMDDQVTKDFKYKDGDFMLESFLNAPAIGVDSTRTVKDIIAQDVIMDDYTNTELLFKTYFSNVSSIGDDPIEIMHLTLTNKLLPILLPKDVDSKGKSPQEVDFVESIPGYDEDIYVKLKIFYIPS